MLETPTRPRRLVSHAACADIHNDTPLLHHHLNLRWRVGTTTPAPPPASLPMPPRRVIGRTNMHLAGSTSPLASAGHISMRHAASIGTEPQASARATSQHRRLHTVRLLAPPPLRHQPPRDRAPITRYRPTRHLRLGRAALKVAESPPDGFPRGFAAYRSPGPDPPLRALDPPPARSPSPSRALARCLALARLVRFAIPTIIAVPAASHHPTKSSHSDADLAVTTATTLGGPWPEPSEARHTLLVVTRALPTALRWQRARRKVGRGGSRVVASQAAPRGGQCESCLFYVTSNALYQI